MAAVIGAVLCFFGALWWFRGGRIKETRLDMSRQGIV